MAIRVPKPRKAAAAAKVAKSADADKRQEIKVDVVLDADEGLDPIYANYADVAAAQYECEINFARVPAKLSQEQFADIRDGKPLRVYPSVKVIVPKDLVPGLIRALSAHIEREKSGETNDDSSAAAA